MKTYIQCPLLCISSALQFNWFAHPSFLFPQFLWIHSIHSRVLCIFPVWKCIYTQMRMYSLYHLPMCKPQLWTLYRRHNKAQEILVHEHILWVLESLSGKMWMCFFLNGVILPQVKTSSDYVEDLLIWKLSITLLVKINVGFSVTF